MAVVAASVIALAQAPAPGQASQPMKPAAGQTNLPQQPLPGEKHFASLKQLTFGGENAEAYFSFDGTKLTSRTPARIRATRSSCSASTARAKSC